MTKKSYIILMNDSLKPQITKDQVESVNKRFAKDVVENPKNDYIKICDLDKDLYSVVTPSITTTEVVATRERIEHINEALNHLGAYRQYSEYLEDIIKNPDAILKDRNGDPNVAVLIKQFQLDDLQFRLILWLKTVDDEHEGYKNSIHTFLYINKKTYNKYMRHTEDILYKNEQRC